MQDVHLCHVLCLPECYPICSWLLFRWIRSGNLGKLLGLAILDTRCISAITWQRCSGWVLAIFYLSTYGCLFKGYLLWGFAGTPFFSFVSPEVATVNLSSTTPQCSECQLYALLKTKCRHVKRNVENPDHTRFSLADDDIDFGDLKWGKCSGIWDPTTCQRRHLCSLSRVV